MAELVLMIRGSDQMNVKPDQVKEYESQGFMEVKRFPMGGDPPGAKATKAKATKAKTKAKTESDES